MIGSEWNKNVMEECASAVSFKGTTSRAQSSRASLAPSAAIASASTASRASFDGPTAPSYNPATKRAPRTASTERARYSVNKRHTNFSTFSSTISSYLCCGRVRSRFCPIQAHGAQRHFFITEASSTRNQVFYFRNDDWAAICKPVLAKLKTTLYERLPEVRFCASLRLAGDVDVSHRMSKLATSASLLSVYSRKSEAFDRSSTFLASLD